MKNSNILRYCCLIVVTIVILLHTGCASHQWALNNKMTTLDTSQESIALMMLTATNQYRPRNWLAVRSIYIEEKSSGEKFVVNAEELGAFINFKLPPGEYSIFEIFGEGQETGIESTFDFYCDINFQLEHNSIVYIGHLDMVNRKRKKGEQRSGYIIPLFDQFWGGFATGTMDITILDRSDEEIEYFKKIYPVLRNYEIKKNTMELKKLRRH